MNTSYPETIELTFTKKQLALILDMLPFCCWEDAETYAYDHEVTVEEAERFHREFLVPFENAKPGVPVTLPFADVVDYARYEVNSWDTREWSKDEAPLVRAIDVYLMFAIGALEPYDENARVWSSRTGRMSKPPAYRHAGVKYGFDRWPEPRPEVEIDG